MIFRRPPASQSLNGSIQFVSQQRERSQSPRMLNYASLQDSHQLAMPESSPPEWTVPAVPTQRRTVPVRFPPAQLVAPTPVHAFQSSTSASSVRSFNKELLPNIYASNKRPRATSSEQEQEQEMVSAKRTSLSSLQVRPSSMTTPFTASQPGPSYTQTQRQSPRLDVPRQSLDVQRQSPSPPVEPPRRSPAPVVPQQRASSPPARGPQLAASNAVERPVRQESTAADVVVEHHGGDAEPSSPQGAVNEPASENDHSASARDSPTVAPAAAALVQIMNMKKTLDLSREEGQRTGVKDAWLVKYDKWAACDMDEWLADGVQLAMHVQSLSERAVKLVRFVHLSGAAQNG